MAESVKVSLVLRYMYIYMGKSNFTCRKPSIPVQNAVPVDVHYMSFSHLLILYFCFMATTVVMTRWLVFCPIVMGLRESPFSASFSLEGSVGAYVQGPYVWQDYACIFSICVCCLCHLWRSRLRVLVSLIASSIEAVPPLNMEEFDPSCPPRCSASNSFRFLHFPLFPDTAESLSDIIENGFLDCLANACMRVRLLADLSNDFCRCFKVPLSSRTVWLYHIAV